MNARRAARAVARALPYGSALVGVLLTVTPARGQIPGENVNMVSGTEWPGGDPFLQRQNEPSIAVSTANPRHLLAGANDYRSVDLPDPVSDPAAQKFAGDAWLGVFKSLDGGQTWQSVLLPGHPRDGTAEGLASPLRGFQAAADPVVRSAPGGLFYFSGITFNRGTDDGQVFVARYLDRNDKENGDATQGLDPIQLVDVKVVDTGATGRFIDKPWIAVDVPRTRTPPCTLGSPARTLPGGALYIAYSAFTGPASSDILFRRSLDCGATWSAPVRLNDSTSTLNQGAIVAVDPISGRVYVAWRRFATGTQTNAIVVARSFSGGARFTRPKVVASFIPFDQGTAATRFRNEALPTLAISVDASGTRSWAHLAWPQRASAGADARVVVSSAVASPRPSGDRERDGDERDDDCGGWSTPVAADGAPLQDDFGQAFSRGHQLMPQLTFTQGRLMLVHYDSRLDHTRGYFAPNQPFAADLLGRFYREQRGPIGELRDAGGAARVFTPEIDDVGLSQTRHTLDVRVGEAAPGPAPSFSMVQLSQYRFGTRGDELPGQQAAGFAAPLQVVDAAGNVQLLQQLQTNPPNLPMFKQGTLPFMGDYIDIAGLPFVPKPGGGWAFNTAPSPAPVHYAVWTTNQDVRPPRDGNWANYTPVGGGGTSVFDPSRTTPACATGQEGMRNQNVYAARITSGLIVTSPQNAKPLSSTITRAFVVNVVNDTRYAKAVRITSSPPAGVAASFRNDGVALASFDVSIPARSSISRALFVRLAGSTDAAASIPVSVAEVAPGTSGCLGALPPTCPLVAGGLTGSITLNPPGSSPSLTQPDGTGSGVPPITSVEVYPARIGSANVTSANVTSANVTSANVTSANVTSANVTSANVTSTHIANPDLANVTSANVTSANVTSANVTSANVTSAPLANVTSANVTSAAISDANFVVENTGNTTHSYYVQIVGSAPGTPLQLIVSRPSFSPIALDCELFVEPRPVVVVNVPDVSGAIVPPGTALGDPNIPDPRPTNVTLTLAPGEKAQVTLRGVLDPAQMLQVTTGLAAVVVPHGGGSIAASLLVSTEAGGLPGARVGVPYAATLQATGGVAPYTWSLAPGSGPPPAGLTLTSDGRIVGTPTAAGTATFTAQVTDAASTPGQNGRTFTLAVSRNATTTALQSSAATVVFGQRFTLAATVSNVETGGPVAGGSVAFLDGGAAAGTSTLGDGVAMLGVAALPVGAHVFTASYPGSPSHAGSESGPVTVRVDPASTAVALAPSVSPSAFGQAVTFVATVRAVSPGAGSPGGSVEFLDGARSLGTVSISGGEASLTVSSLSVGSHAITASYGGEARFLAGSSPALDIVVDPANTTVTLAATPAEPGLGQVVTLTATVVAQAPGAGTPTGDVTFLDGASPLGTASLVAGKATFATALLGAGGHTLSATYAGDGNFAGGASGAAPLSVARGSTTTSLTASTTACAAGKPVILTATVAAILPATGTPGGMVTFLEGTTVLGTATLVGGTASLTTSALAVGGHAVTATYAGDGSFAGSTSSPLSLEVRPSYTFTGFLSPLKAAGTVANPTSSGTQSCGSAVPIKWRLKDGSGATVTSLSSTRSLVAYRNAACSGPPPDGVPGITLHPPTSGATGGSTFKYTDGAFHFNWDTSVAIQKGCYVIVLTLDDGTQKATLLNLK
jgi:hypothetical protein